MTEELKALNEMINKFVEILLEVECEKQTAVNISSLNNTLRLALHDKLDIIESALKKQEQDEKEHKALDIIKEKRVIIDDFITCSELWIYNQGKPEWKQLTQEEYDILKEILK